MRRTFTKLKGLIFGELRNGSYFPGTNAVTDSLRSKGDDGPFYRHAEADARQVKKGFASFFSFAAFVIAELRHRFGRYPTSVAPPEMPTVGKPPTERRSTDAEPTMARMQGLHIGRRIPATR
jgi:hypothetical protein